MESRTKNKKSREVIAEMVKRSFPGISLAEEKDAVAELKEGWFNVAYQVKLSDGRESILKIAPPAREEVLSYEKNIMSTEVSMMRIAAAGTGIKIPEVYYYDEKRDICDSDYFFMEKLQGRNFGNIKQDMEEGDVRTVNLEIGRCLSRMNELVDRSYFGLPGNPELRSGSWREAFLLMVHAALEDGRKKQVNIGCPYEELIALVERYAPYLEDVSTPHFVHWDCWDSNVFVKEGRLSGIIDFERAFWGDILIESIFRTRIPDQLEGYGKTELTAEENIKCRLYDAYLYLIMIVECSYRHYDDDSILLHGSKQLRDTLDWLRKAQGLEQYAETKK